MQVSVQKAFPPFRARTTRICVGNSPSQVQTLQEAGFPQWYGFLKAVRQSNGARHSDVADMLQQTLDQEGETDHKLTELAEAYVNEEASVE